MTYREGDWIWLKRPSKPVQDYWRTLNEELESLADFTSNDLVRKDTFGWIQLHVRLFNALILYKEGQRLGVEHRRRK